MPPLHWGHVAAFWEHRSPCGLLHIYTSSTKSAKWTPGVWGCHWYTGYIELGSGWNLVAPLLVFPLEWRKKTDTLFIYMSILCNSEMQESWQDNMYLYRLFIFKEQMHSNNKTPNYKNIQQSCPLIIKSVALVVMMISYLHYWSTSCMAMNVHHYLPS
jgi:hypothetical protein